MTLLDKKIADAERAIKAAEESCKAMDERMDLLAVDPSAAAAENRIKQTQQTILLTKDAVNSYKTNIASVQQQIDDLVKAMESYTQSAEYLAAEELERTLATMRGHRSDLIKTSQNLESEIDALDEEAAQQQEQLVQLREEEIEAKNQLQMTEDAILLIGPMSAALKEECEGILNNIELTNKVVAETAADLETRTAEYDKLLKLHEGLCDVAAEKLLPV